MARKNVVSEEQDTGNDVASKTALVAVRRVWLGPAGYTIVLSETYGYPGRVSIRFDGVEGMGRYVPANADEDAALAEYQAKAVQDPGHYDAILAEVVEV
jgi:hypothetical protein